MQLTALRFFVLFQGDAIQNVEAHPAVALSLGGESQTAAIRRPTGLPIFDEGGGLPQTAAIGIHYDEMRPVIFQAVGGQHRAIVVESWLAGLLDQQSSLAAIGLSHVDIVPARAGVEDGEGDPALSGGLRGWLAFLGHSNPRSGQK